jgi:glyoxylase-like metal-dependent hydrolase (beta-lactamase superfamily II)
MSDPRGPSVPDPDPVWGSRSITEAWRVVVADNPGPLTLDGTNSYVRQTDEGAIVVDPGPVGAPHRAALEAAAPDLRLVLLTHGHADHSDCALELAEQHGAVVRALDPAWCLGASPLRDEEVVTLGGASLTVLATPGHTVDSVCLLEPARSTPSLVVSGDTLLGRGTTFVSHPEGRLADYFGALQRLADRVDHRTLVLPGHGPVRGDALNLVLAYQTHRQQRLDEVRSAWIRGARDPDEVVEAVYGPLVGPLRAAARASTLAQLSYLGLLREE